ncbi:hypothetical protein PR048_031909 [Dryococelus australis]|uniref:Uncharacterized protein n=1 Tax=Dryococelus australis TaxID=614101 RepID=A0ABQ9G6L8_9NEOP|nr:hypothetical protein PR048_031909 [Dryococelus australis]
MVSVRQCAANTLLNPVYSHLASVNLSAEYFVYYPCPLCGIQKSQCRRCAHTFSTKTGCALHEKRGIEVEFNAAASPGPPKGHNTLWTDKELHILAYFSLGKEDGNFGHTFSASTALAEGVTTIRRDTGEQQEVSASTSGVVTIRERWLSLLDDLEEVHDESFRVEILELAARCAVEGTPLEEVWVTHVASTKRAQHRYEYAVMQNMWKRDRARVARSVLEGERLDQEVQILSETAEVPEEYGDDPHGMAIPITSKEVKRAEIYGQSASGSDVENSSNRCKDDLIPKKVPLLPSDFRPISIASIVMRQYHKILARRIQSSIQISAEQRAFLNSDGLAENLTLLSEVLHSVSSQLKLTYLAVLDVKKALDTGTTSIQLPGLIKKDLPIHQGVWQGDPLSSGESLQFGRWSVGGGVEISSEKSHSLSLVAMGKTRQIKVLTEALLKLGDQFLSPLGISESWKYLCISFTARGVKAFRKELEESLRRISEAPLKPFQRMEILRTFLYHLSFARVSIGIMKAMDILGRAAVRRWLKLPKDVALGIFHASSSASGLGILSLLQCSSMDFGMNEERGQIRLSPDALLGSVFLLFGLLASVNGKDLLPAKGSKMSTSWLVVDARVILAWDYILYLQICRVGFDEVELAYHISQQCIRTHEARMARHDIVRVVAENCARLRKPDLVAVHKQIGKAVVMDIQIVQATNLAWSYNTKMKKYSMKDLASVMSECGVEEVSVIPITLTWKGSWFAESASELQEIIGGEAFLKSLGDARRPSAFSIASSVLSGGSAPPGQLLDNSEHLVDGWAMRHMLEGVTVPKM